MVVILMCTPNYFWFIGITDIGNGKILNCKSVSYSKKIPDILTRIDFWNIPLKNGYPLLVNFLFCILATQNNIMYSVKHTSIPLPPHTPIHKYETVKIRSYSFSGKTNPIKRCVLLKIHLPLLTSKTFFVALIKWYQP